MSTPKRPPVLKLSRATQIIMLNRHNVRMETARVADPYQPICPDHYCPGKVCGCREPQPSK